MNSKFYYKSSTLLMMLLAGHTVSAHAADDSVTTEKSEDNDQKSPSEAEAVTYPVAQTIDASAKPYNLEIKSTEEVKTEAVTTEAPTTEKPVVKAEEVETEPVMTEAVTTEAPMTEKPAVNAEEVKAEPVTTEAATTETPTTEKPAGQAEEVKAEPVTTEAATTETPTTEKPAVQAEEVETEPVTTEAATTETPTTEKPAVQAEEVETEPVTTEAPTTEKPAAETKVVKTEVTTTELPVTQSVLRKKTTVKRASTTEVAVAKKPSKSSLSTRSFSLAAPSTTRTLTASTTTATAPASINDYILSQNYVVPTYKQDFAPELPQLAYRNGAAKPEGVVAHETANPTSTIYGEVAYMKNNWQNAFVHAFIDDNEIIETANTDYIAWGSGAAGNARFIQVELVRVYGKDRFAKAINNYADYIAMNLHYYGLPVDSAEYDGQGTLWSHKAVSNYLGGTDHTDPYGWFQENGYTMDDLAALVTLKYNQKVQAHAGTGPVVTVPTQPTVPTEPTTPTAPAPGPPVVSNEYKLARIKTSTAPVFSAVTDTTATPAAEKKNYTYYVNKKADYNGKTYYALTDETGVGRGWVEASNLTQATLSPEKTVTSKFKVNSLISGIYSMPWGKYSQKYDDLASQVNQAFNPTKKVTVNSTDYYFGSINGYDGWISGKHLSVPDSTLGNISPVMMYGKTLYSGATVYKDITLTNSYKDSTPYRQLYITKKGTSDGETYYHVLNEASQVMGWINDNQIRQTSAQLVSTAKMPYKVSASTAKIYTMPSGGSVQQLVKDKNLKNQYFNVVRTEKIGGSLWMKGVVSSNNTVGWIAADYLTEQSSVFQEMKRVSMMGKTLIKGSTVYLDNDLRTKRATKSYNMNYFVQSQAKQGDTVYYYAVDHLSRPVGWISDAEIQQASRRIVSTNKKTYVISTPASYLYNTAAGTKYQRVEPLSDKLGTPFHIIRTEKIGTALWHKGRLENSTTYGWIADRFLSRLTEVAVPAAATLDAAVAKQMALPDSSKPKVVYADQYGRTLTRNATEAEVRANIDSSKFSSDSIQKYQFLNLNKSQGITATVLNALLTGMGILENQGTAFAEAAKLYNINEIYLISHALLETGNGTSQLSNGMGYNPSTKQAYTTTTGTKYYNMYGTGAVDHNALNGGTSYAYSQGWDTPAKAIVGGAQFVAQNYFGNKQLTLYQMRWNPANPATHQYATDIKWAAKNAYRLADFYRRIELTGLNFLIDQYK
ncbi:N-acetylmuramoyl-L-alanine amidase [Macrococcus carouselicus]|nr:N-acetylmuramoyl-L-alanine amidase [Macrococcus carouselicus]